MCMVGYEDDPTVPGGGYFIIRNSWATTWASKSAVAPGYARLPYAYMQQYASAAHTATVTDAKKKEEPKNAEVGFLEQLFALLRKLFGGRA
jgi:C1A family cysteine protease